MNIIGKPLDKLSNMFRRVKKSRLYKNYWESRYLFLMLVPAVIYYIVFHYMPIYGVQIAFKNFRFNKGIWGSPWIGFQHFIDIFALESFWEVFSNTIIISIYKLIFGFPAQILLAILLNEIRHERFKKTVQTISYLPHFISWVILAGVFTQFLSPSIGPVNVLLRTIKMKPIYFMADLRWFRTILVSTDVWKTVGWNSIIYLAALTGINPELYEASIVDGASRLKRIIYITIPSLAPVITIMLIFAVGNLIKDDFDQVYNMYNASVYKVADVISTYTYRKGLIDMEYSFSTAVGLFKNVLSFILIIIANWTAKHINEYGIW